MADKPAPKKKKAETGRFKAFEGSKSKNRSCPKCGNGFYLAEHKERRTCGKCGYVESKK